MKADNTRPAEPEEMKEPVLERAIRLLNEKVSFTGEQYVPGAGVEICYEHYGRYAFAEQFVGPDTVVLDLGCGTGYGSLFLSKKAKHVIALDCSPECISTLRDCIEAAGVDNITAVCADGLAIDRVPELSDVRIDVVVCHEFIEHITEEQQKAVCRLVASGEPPFHPETVFLVSTPERSRYAELRDEPNEFHVHELSEKEFRDLLTEHFAHVRLYTQSNAAANLLMPLEYRADEVQAPRMRFLNWLDWGRVLASYQDLPPSAGTFLYAVAGGREQPKPLPQSLIVDLRQRIIGEQMSIAAKELQALQNELIRSRSERERLRRELMLARQEAAAASESGGSLTTAYEQVIEQQAEKIRSLLAENECIAADQVEASELRDRLSKVNASPSEALEELIGWRELGMLRLGPTLPEAQVQAAVLWSYVYAMNSPGHRVVSRIGRSMQKTWIGRKGKSLLQFLMALRQA